MNANIEFGNFILSYMTYTQFESLKFWFLLVAGVIVLAFIIWSQLSRINAAHRISADFEKDRDSRRFHKRVFRLLALFPFGRKY